MASVPGRRGIRILIAGRRRGSSGIRTYTDALAAGLASLSQEVHLLDESAGDEPLPAPAVQRVALPRAGRAEHALARLGPVRGWARHPQLRRLARELDADVVHATYLDLAPGFERPVVTAWDPLVSPLARYRAARGRSERPHRETAYAVIDAVACRRANAIVAVTPAVARNVRVLGRPVHFIPPFIADEAIRRPDPVRAESVAMVAGRLDSERKGLALAIEAIRAVREERPDLRLTLVGGWSDPDARGRLPAFCDAVGPLPRTELLESLAGFGCCILPSLWEEFSYAGLEALAAGVPVACSPELGIAQMSGGGIFVAQARTAQALAAATLRALSAEQFAFPQECRASEALRRVLDVYAVTRTTGDARGARRPR